MGTPEVQDKQWLIEVLNHAATFQEVYRKASKAEQEGLTPLQAVGLTGLERDAAQILGQVMSQASPNGQVVAPDHRSAFNHRLTLVDLALTHHLGKGLERALGTGPGALSELIRQLNSR